MKRGVTHHLQEADVYFGRAQSAMMVGRMQHECRTPAVLAPNFTGPIVSPSGEPQLVGVDMLELERQCAWQDELWESSGFFDAMVENMTIAVRYAGRPKYRKDWS